MRCLPLCLLALFLPCSAVGDEIDDALAVIRAVGPEGAGSPGAQAAWKRLERAGPQALPRLLVAMDTPDSVRANWLRLAFDAIADRHLDAVDPEPLLAFARDAKRQGRPRRLALDLAERKRPGTRAKLLAGWLDDPEFGHDAVAQQLESLAADKAGKPDQAIATLRKVFDSCRDLEQARTVATRLKERGVTVSVARQMGFLRDWFVVGPFDGTGKKGFTSVYPPERSVDLRASYPGKDGKQLRWQRHTAEELPTGRFPILIDLTKPLGNADDAVAFAWTAFDVPEAREVELRGAADDNLSVWVNGKKVFAFEEYQNGVRLDRHRIRARLQAGVNTILVKVCQSPPDLDNTAPNWEFLLRLTDSTGKGLTFPPSRAMR